MSRPTIRVILLAGGTGTRMQTSLPKQFLLINEKPIVKYSFDVFRSMPEIDEIIVVCEKEYRQYFIAENTKTKVSFAEPGLRRQDSVYNGLQSITEPTSFICIHDGARPFIDTSLVKRVLDAAKQHGAATAAMPVKFTVKQSDANGVVKHTPDRSTIWEIQTPQIIEYSLLRQGFDYAHQHDLEVTDDVSLVENLNKPVQLVKGSYQNIKITTPEDLLFANALASI